MADRLRSRTVRASRDFPVGIPVVPPPGWRPRTSPPPLPSRRPPRSPFRAQVGLVLKAALLSLLVIVCMGIGWLLTQGRRSDRVAPGTQALAQMTAKRETGNSRRTPERTPQRTERPKEDEKEPPPVLKKEAPERKQERPAPKPDPVAPKEEPRPESTPPLTPPPRNELTYEKHILPIMQRSCLSCHGGGKKRGGLDLRTYAALLRGGDNGTGVLPGKPNDSPLYETIAAGRMPPGKRKLPAADRERIREWIARGAKSERGER